MSNPRIPARRGHRHKAARLLSDTLTAGDILYVNASGDLALLPIGTAGQVLTEASGLPSWAAAGGGGATQLTDLTDVNTAGVTNRNVLVADGVDFESRALVEADISDLGTYLTDIVSDTTPQLGGTLDSNDFDINFTSTSYSWTMGSDETNGWFELSANNPWNNEWGFNLDVGGWFSMQSGADVYTTLETTPILGDTLYNQLLWNSKNGTGYFAEASFNGDSFFQFGNYVQDAPMGFYVTQGSSTGYKYAQVFDAENGYTYFGQFPVRIGNAGNTWENASPPYDLTAPITYPTDYVEHEHDGTSFNVTGTNTLNYNFFGMSNVQVADGAGLWVFDAGNTDAISFSHDGTDASILGTLSADLNITGFTNVDISGNIVVSGTVDGVDVAALNTTVADLPVANLADGTDGELITWSAAGAPTTVAVGTSGHVLTSNGAGAAPTFQAAAGGGGGFNSGVISVNEGATLSTYSNQPVAGNWWQGNNRFRYKMDLSEATSIRLICQVSVASASVNTPVAQVRYATSLPVNYAATSAIGSGATECEVSLSTGGIFVDSGWITITAAAAVDNVYLAFCGLGGNASADPAVADTLIMWK